ncbi:ABC transporter ATP-binding protein [Geobacter sulfurreducens]|uniref:ABC transporter ATP-binding protein n=1 Tax=Geobacter sulfurreducens TaxID=35554 RepID=UPI0001D8F364|nr:ABC transporter ATP-binding protein [Geobacter sulfurreducens]ADI85374.1 peptide ABC transporter, ATP-binding protein [Geobacter sulfurreducens KN400]AJY68920.1 peptide ABC transporter ATPase [Geobacter sulfurreducens]QVW34446.1 ABC transporter ATP-binding protein [Geobacter sulfurreducens]UTG91964.1 ABC transporter ATP-binding protein [Geobacter sulfurreducens]
MANLLDIRQLSTVFHLAEGDVHAVNGVDISIAAGETVALVGESGCGKSVTAASILRLVPPPGEITEGEIRFEGTDLLAASEAEMRSIRGNRIGMIFQEPMTSLNPVFRIGSQIAEGLILHRRLGRRAAREEAERLLAQVGIPEPASRLDSYPHQLSGGMRQRVMIAMALACGPRLLIADEPTTALDVTIQAQILELLDRLGEEHRMALLLITHDLGVVAERADRTMVMYAGRIVEEGLTAELVTTPLHPYTDGLLASLPQRSVPGEPLRTIAGQVPSLVGGLAGCGFCNRCPRKVRECAQETPPLIERSPGHRVRCWNPL